MLVADDDERIADVVRGFSGRSRAHTRGSRERAETAGHGLGMIGQSARPRTPSDGDTGTPGLQAVQLGRTSTLHGLIVAYIRASLQPSRRMA